jgi:hypothetical protein
MGTWGADLFEDDIALDVLDEFEDGLAAGLSPSAAADRVLAEMPEAAEDVDDGPVIRLALAALLLDNGVKRHAILEQALHVLETGAALERWEESDPPTLAARHEVCRALQERLSQPLG